MSDGFDLSLKKNNGRSQDVVTRLVKADSYSSFCPDIFLLVLFYFCFVSRSLPKGAEYKKKEQQKQSIERPGYWFLRDLSSYRKKRSVVLASFYMPFQKKKTNDSDFCCFVLNALKKRGSMFLASWCVPWQKRPINKCTAFVAANIFIFPPRIPCSFLFV